MTNNYLTPDVHYSKIQKLCLERGLAEPQNLPQIS